MCKLVAMVNLDKQIPVGKVSGIANMFKHLLYINSYKNTDGTGVFRVDDDGELSMYKRGLPSPDFLQLDLTKKLLDIKATTKFLVGHTRYGTVGGVSDKNAHPFQHGHITLVQNGTSHYGYSGLVRNKVEPKELKVDSEHVCWAIAQQGAKETFKEYEGAGVFIWYDSESKTLNITKNDERDLHFAKVSGTNVVMITTDWAALEYTSYRAGLDLEEVKEFPDDMLVSYHLDGKVSTNKEIRVIPEVGTKYLVNSYGYNTNSKKESKSTNTSVSGFVGRCACCDSAVYSYNDYAETEEGELICDDCLRWAPEAFGISEGEITFVSGSDNSKKLKGV